MKDFVVRYIQEFRVQAETEDEAIEKADSLLPCVSQADSQTYEVEEQ